VNISRLNPQKARERLDWQARYQGRRLAQLLVSCELDNSIGPLPWISG
jgi:hypothetical protein